MTPEQKARYDRIRQRTKSMRDSGKLLIPLAADNPAIINDCTALLQHWRPGSAQSPAVWALNDVREYDGIPYRCCQPYTDRGDHPQPPPGLSAHWAQYHGTSVETARPYIQPLGAHDAYQTNEYAIEGGKVYRCKKDATVFPPSTLPGSWEAVTDAAPGGSTPEQPAEPELTPEPADEWPEFVQPTGAHNTYAKGAQITYKGKRYTSEIANNSYSPDAYPAGWKLAA